MSDSGNESGAPPVGSDGITINVFGRTDVGLVREHNEDNFLVADLSAGNRSIKPEVRTHEVGNQGSLFIVCDGMGGAAAGEVASQLGVDTIYDMMQEAEPAHDDEGLARQLDAAISEAGVRIFTAAKVNRKQRGMGTTVTAAVLKGPRLIIGQVGDSRAYIVRRGELTQVTKDQSLVQQLIDAKQLTEEEARFFDRSNIILQALGTTEEVHVDMTSVVLRRGDTLVMCSDGLSGLVEDDAIRDVVMQLDDPLEMCKRLTDLACEGGGHDNITVVVARFDGGGLLEPRGGETIFYEKFQYTPLNRDAANRSRFKDEGEPSVVEEIGRPLEDVGRGRVTRRRKSSVPLLFLGALAGLIAGGAVVAYNMFSEGKRNLVAPPGTSLDASSFAAGSDPEQVLGNLGQPMDTEPIDASADSKKNESGAQSARMDTSLPGQDMGTLPGGTDLEEEGWDSLIKRGSQGLGTVDDQLQSDTSTGDGESTSKAIAEKAKGAGARPQTAEKKVPKKPAKKRDVNKSRQQKKQDAWRPPDEEAPKELDENPF